MDTIKTPSRIHPLMAAAAVSVIAFSLVGTAAVTGMLPASKADQVPAGLGAPSAAVAASALAGTAAAGYQPVQAPTAVAPAAALTSSVPAGYVPVAAPGAPAGYQQVAYVPVAAAPVEAIAKAPAAAPAPKKTVVHKVVHHTAPAPQYAYQQPAPAPRQPNYVGIGAGALIGGLLGNQVGGGRGRTLATVAGAIGGGMLGNEIANRQQQR